MAKGSFTFDPSSYLQGKIDWSSSSNGSVANSSSVTATLFARRTNSFETYGKTWDGYITIDGEMLDWDSLTKTTYVSDDWVKIKSYTRTVKHNNDGTKSITISGSISGPDSTQLADARSRGSKTVKLDDIPRQATLSSASNFTDEENPSVTYSNSAGDAVDKIEIGIFDEKGETKYVDYREIPKTGDENSTTDISYTFSLTEDERNALRKAAESNTLSVGFYLKTTIGGTAITPFSSIVKTLTLENHTPIVEPSVVDINETTLALTGDKFKLIRYHSSAYAVINAMARKYATITDRRITNGQTSVSGSTATFDNVGSNSFIFYAKDSRNNAVTKTIDVSLSWINYVHVTCNTKPSNPTADGDMILNISGNYWNGNFGAVNNELTLQMRLAPSESNFGDTIDPAPNINGIPYTQSEWITLTPIFNGNAYNIDVPITGLDYQTNYKFEVKSSDKLEETPVKTFSVQTKTIFDWSDEDFQFNVPVNVDGNITNTGNISTTGSLDVSGEIINPNLDMFNDTSGNSWSEMMKNKIDYCINNIKVTSTNKVVPINGGWSGVNYGFGLFSKIGEIYQLIWFSNNVIRYCRKSGSTYEYTSFYENSMAIKNTFPVGSVFTTSTNTNPANLGLPGTWELYDKQFKDVYEYKSGTAIATLTSLASLGVRITRTGHMVHIDCNAETKANITDTTLSVCTLKPAVLGFTGALADRMMYFTGYSDGGNNMIQFGMSAKSFVLESYDAVGDDSHKVSSGATIIWSQTIVADSFTQLADAYCDKFFWKRTA
jgi:hypothetical protein